MAAPKLRAPAVVTVTVTKRQLALLVDALDSHCYERAPEAAQRNSGFIVDPRLDRAPGDALTVEEQEVADFLDEHDALEQQLRDAAPAARPVIDHPAPVAAPARPFVWLARCDDIFGGYGLLGVGVTAEEAKQALWKRYKAVSPEWSGLDPVCRSLKALYVQWGVNVSRYRVGEGYFGDDEAKD